MPDPLAPINLDSESDKRLWNWGRWAKDRQRKGISMTGIICDRLAKENLVFEDHPAPIPINLQDALTIERAWQHIPKRAQTITRGHYVLSIDHRALARTLHFRFNDWDWELTKASTMLINAALLTTRSFRSNITPNPSNSAPLRATRREDHR